MECQACREALSARIDDELADVEAQAVEAHVQRCAGCAGYAERLDQLTRAARLQPAAPVPDLTPQILARLHRKPRASGTRAWLRVGLAVLAVVQVAFALSDLFGGGAHEVREAASWHVALAVGFFAVAWRPPRAAGLVPVLAAATVGLLVTAGLDVAAGHASLLEEARHAVKLVGLVLLWGLSPHPPAFTARRAVSG